MAKEKAPEEPSGDVPIWFLTYSDVITLLMTFFILLLTFATDEPEKFERMQVSMFGGSGSSGIAGENQGALDQDSFVMRERPRSGRITMRGSEIPPEHSDPSLTALTKGLQSLQDESQFDPLANYRLLTQTSLLVDGENQITAIGEQRMHMIGRQLEKGPYSLVIEVANEDGFEQAWPLSQYLIEQQGLPVGKVGISVNPYAIQRADTIGWRIVQHAGNEG
ncbi:MAG: flagellar motor protein MotB [Planctomycetales bacterium]|nr:flagellar motor protein MotB [Planctomycetales bacterium]